MVKELYTIGDFVKQIAPALLLAAFGFIWHQIQQSDERITKTIEELKVEVKEQRAFYVSRGVYAAESMAMDRRLMRVEEKLDRLENKKLTNGQQAAPNYARTE